MKWVRYTREIFLLRLSLQYKLQYEYSIYYLKRKNLWASVSCKHPEKSKFLEMFPKQSSYQKKKVDCILGNNLSLLYTSPVLLTSLHWYTEFTTKEIESGDKTKNLTLPKHLPFLINLFCDYHDL